MICRASRDRLATALRQYVSCRISNDDLADVDVDWRDRGAVAVREAAWFLYSDTTHHYATGRHAVTKKDRREVAKWVVFLHSAHEYLWPEYSFIQIGLLFYWPMNVLTFGWWGRQKRRRWSEFQVAGDYSAWPFLREADAGRAAAQPRFLNGRSRFY